MPDEEYQRVWRACWDYRGEHWQRHVTPALPDVRWDDLVKLASQLRNGIACRVLEGISAGARHFVKIIEFADRTRWLVRVAISAADSEWTRANRQSEVETQTILHDNHLPVPKVHWHEPTGTRIGRSFMLMELLPGNSIADMLSLRRARRDNLDGVLYSEKFLRAIANFQVRLSNIRADGIGKVFKAVDGGLDVRPAGDFLVTDLSLSEYIEDWADRMRDEWSDPGCKAFVTRWFEEAESKDKAWSRSLQFPDLIEKIAALPMFSAETLGTLIGPPFPIGHLDFHYNNILIDENGDFVGVIDWEGAKTMPWPLVDIPPCVHSPMPELLGRDHYLDPDLPRKQARTERYIELVKEYETQLGTDRRLSDILSNRAYRCLAEAVRFYENDGSGDQTDKLKALFFPEDSETDIAAELKAEIETQAGGGTSV